MPILTVPEILRALGKGSSITVQIKTVMLRNLGFERT